MPNIEIHGLERAESKKVCAKIFEIFAGESYVDEMVVTVYETIVLNREAKDQPFLRLVNSCQKHTLGIINKLRTLGMDIEHLELESFIPGRKLSALSLSELCSSGSGKFRPVVVIDSEPYLIESDQDKFELAKKLCMEFVSQGQPCSIYDYTGREVFVK